MRCILENSNTSLFFNYIPHLNKIHFGTGIANTCSKVAMRHQQITQYLKEEI